LDESRYHVHGAIITLHHLNCMYLATTHTQAHASTRKHTQAHASTRKHPRHVTRNTIRNTQYAIRNTQYAIRNTQYALHMIRTCHQQNTHTMHITHNTYNYYKGIICIYRGRKDRWQRREGMIKLLFILSSQKILITALNTAIN
jgi:hypothetical protein